jgi:hypothetical protein
MRHPQPQAPRNNLNRRGSTELPLGVLLIGHYACVTELTEQSIVTTPDEDLPMLVWGSVADRAIENYRALRPDEQTFWLVELLNYEVGNGGFVQYFANTEGEYVDDTVQALRAIGALGQCAVFEEAVARWRVERPTLEPLWQTIGGIQRVYELSRLTELDDRWYDTAIEPFEAAFIRANIASFVS